MGERKLSALVLGILMVGTPAWASPSGEVQKDIDKLRGNVQEIMRNLEALTQNIRIEAKNLEDLEKELEAKGKAQDEVKKSITETETSLKASFSSEKDFQESLQRDQELVDNTKEEIIATKGHLTRLEENLRILRDNIDIDRDNIDKILRTRDSHEKNLKNYRATADELSKASRGMEAQAKARKESLTRTEQEVKRWKHLLEARKKDLEKMEGNQVSKGPQSGPST